MQKKIIALIMLIFFFCACTSAPKTSRGTSPVKIDSESQLFSEAETLFRLKSYTQALKLYDDYLSRFPDKPSAPEALIREGAIYSALKKYETARKVYKHLIDKYPKSFLVPDAKIEILITFYNERRFKQVIHYADEIAKEINSRVRVVRIYVLLGDTYMAIGSPVNAVHFYAKAHENSRYAEKKDIVIRFKEAIERISVKDTHFLLERVQDKTTRGHLLYRLARHYIDEARYEDAQNILSEFVNSFPQHEKLSQAKQWLSEFKRKYSYNLYTIGCMLPLSGSYTIYGNKALQGIQLALEHTMPQGDPIRLIVKDTGSNPDEAVRKVKELANEKVSAIIGPIISAEAAASEAQHYQIPIITLTQKDKITDIGDCVFRNFITPKMQVEAIVSYAMRNLGLSNFAVLYPDEKYGETFMKLFWDEVRAYGGNVSGVESYQPHTKDFGTAIRRLKRQQNGPIEGVFIPDAPTKAGLIIPQLSYYGINNVYLFGTNLWHSKKIFELVTNFSRGAYIPEVFFAESNSLEVRKFIRTFREKFGDSPGFLEALAYDSAKMLFQTILQPNVRSLKDELMRIHNFTGVTGPTAFESSGEARKKLYLLQIRRGKFFEVENY